MRGWLRQAGVFLIGIFCLIRTILPYETGNINSVVGTLGQLELFVENPRVVNGYAYGSYRSQSNYEGGNSRDYYARFFPSALIFIAGACCLAFGMFSGIYWLAISDKFRWKMLISLWGIVVGVILVAHGMTTFLNVLTPLNRRSEGPNYIPPDISVFLGVE